MREVQLKIDPILVPKILEKCKMLLNGTASKEEIYEDINLLPEIIHGRIYDLHVDQLTGTSVSTRWSAQYTELLRRALLREADPLIIKTYVNLIEFITKERFNLDELKRTDN